jgi:hypothetical protein
MKNFNLCKADPVGDQEIESVTIIIDEKIPKIDFKNDDWRHKYNIFYDKEAEELFQVLINSLPGATIDRLLIKLLQQRASLFRVTF